MARRRTIVGIGEAMMAEYPDREEPAGLAPLVAINAMLLGHRGLAISRLGQDDAAGRLLERLRAAGLDTSHLQSDPDLATGRLRARRPNRLEAQLAFDNLQWDFDLADVAQQADAVVFGAAARRTGQARSTIDRFLAESAVAIRIFDLTNRPGEGFDRGTALAALRGAEAAVVDLAAVRTLVPTVADAAPRDAILRLMREADLAFALLAEAGHPPVVHTPQSAHEGHEPAAPGEHYAIVVALAHGVLAGWTMRDALRLAEEFARHRRDRPQERMPADRLEPGSA